MVINTVATASSDASFLFGYDLLQFPAARRERPRSQCGSCPENTPSPAEPAVVPGVFATPVVPPVVYRPVRMDQAMFQRAPRLLPRRFRPFGCVAVLMTVDGRLPAFAQSSRAMRPVCPAM